MTAVAIFSTYAPSEGFGGQARIYHQRRALEAAGLRVVHVVLQANPDDGATRPYDMVKLIERPFRAPIDHIYEDVDLGRRAAADRRLVQAITSHLEAQGTGAIVMEQPFLVGIVAQVAKALNVPVVYSCQNVEFRLRRDLERFQLDWRRSPERSDEVRRLEAEAIALADHVTTICPTDQWAIREEFGCDSIVVPNGTSTVGVEVPLPDRVTNGRMDPIDFVYAGSAYWPNVEGLAQVANPSLAFLPPTAKIDVIGSICRGLLEAPAIARHLSTNRSRLVLHGFLPMNELVATMRAARCVIVPVFVGEGSNLKSADALGAGVPVIMTKRATHGYEDLLEADSEGVTVVETAREFRAAMTQTLAQPHCEHVVGDTRRTMLSWSSRLEPLVGVIRSLIGLSR